MAIIVGEPPANGPVPVRLHSACLTGDLLGSLRCDCGPQLQRAVARLAETGGVLLYLAQEGRATGLANNGTATYNYYARLSASDVGQNMAAIATTGNIKRPPTTVPGTADAPRPDAKPIMNRSLTRRRRLTIY